MRRALPVLVLALLAAPVQAQETPPSPPVEAKISLDLQKVGTVDRAVTFVDKAFRVSGTVTPFVPGQEVRVRLYRGSQVVETKTKPIRASESGDVGLFRAAFRTSAPGKLRIGVTHVRTDAMDHAQAATGPVRVIAPALRQGDRGYSVKVMQLMLRDLGYVTGRYGVYDARTARAVLAFRKVSGLERITTASRTVLRRMHNGGGVFRVRFPGKGRHVEADLGAQVVALVDGDKVERIYPTSSGKPSTPTVLGSWRVYYRILGLSPKGLVNPSFFTGGYAIHGWKSVPTYPASAGCLRVPIPDALSIYRWIRMGTWISTYYRDGKQRSPKRISNPGP